MPGRYPEAEHTDEQASNPETVVIDMQEFRKNRKIVDYNAKQQSRPKGASGAGARHEPVE